MRASSRRLATPRGRQPVNDAAQMAVEALARLWFDVHKIEPNYAYNAHGFGGLCIAMLGPDELGFRASELRVSVRAVIAERSTYRDCALRRFLSGGVQGGHSLPLAGKAMSSARDGS